MPLEPMAAFDAVVSRAPASTVRESAAEAISFVNRYCQPEAIGDIVRSVCADENLMASCGRRATEHPLGFDKYVLYSVGSYALRLHIWWPGQERVREHIHNHRFSFASAVILGGMNVESYRPSSDGATYVRYQETRDIGRFYAYQPRGQLGVGLSALHSLGPGSSYYLGANEYHRVQAPDQGLSATLFVGLSHDRSTTDILVNVDQRPPTVGARTSMGVPEAKRRLAAFCRALANE